jgi:COP9 signalosome complex subunit 4
MEAKLSHLATLAQKDKTPAYLSLLSETLSRPDPSADLHVLIDAVANPDVVGLVTGRQVISELVKNIGAGTITNHDIRKRVVEGALATLQPRIASYEEQVLSPGARVPLATSIDADSIRSTL